MVVNNWVDYYIGVGIVVVGNKVVDKQVVAYKVVDKLVLLVKDRQLVVQQQPLFRGDGGEGVQHGGD